MSVALLAGDRYFVVGYRLKSARYRNYRIALFILLCVWALLIGIVLLPIIFSKPVAYKLPEGIPVYRMCLVIWPGYSKV